MRKTYAGGFFSIGKKSAAPAMLIKALPQFHGFFARLSIESQLSISIFKLHLHLRSTA
jgi:hypothetical protein